MRGIIIDPFNRTIEEADGDWGDYRQIQAVVGGRFDDIRLRPDLILSVDDEGKMPHRPKAWFRVEGYGKALTGRALLTGAKPGSRDAWPVGEQHSLDRIQKMVRWVDPAALTPEDTKTGFTIITGDKASGKLKSHKQLRRMMQTTDGVRPQPLATTRAPTGITSANLCNGGPLLERLAKASWSPPSDLPLFSIPNFRLSLPVAGEVRRELKRRLEQSHDSTSVKPPFPRFTVEFPENLGELTHWMWKGPVIYYFDFVSREVRLIGLQSKAGEQHVLRVRPCPVESLEIGRIVAELLSVQKVATHPVGLPGALSPLAKKRLKATKRSYVLIDLNRTTYQRAVATGTGSRKCYHSVRGHWRRIGPNRRVWIEEHFRGDEALGTTAPRYAVKRLQYDELRA